MLFIAVYLLLLIQIYYLFSGFLLFRATSLQMSDEPFCLSTSSPSLCFPSARSISLRQAPGMPLSSCLAFVVAAVRVERLLLRKSAARLLARSHTCPNAGGNRNDLPRFIVVCEARQSVCLGRVVMPRRRCVSRKDCRVLSKRTFPRARERVRTPQFFVFCLHPSPTCIRYSKSN